MASLHCYKKKHRKCTTLSICKRSAQWCHLYALCCAIDLFSSCKPETLVFIPLPLNYCDHECFSSVMSTNLISIPRPVLSSHTNCRARGAVQIHSLWTAITHCRSQFTNPCAQHPAWAATVSGVVICTSAPARNENNHQLLKCL